MKEIAYAKNVGFSYIFIPEINKSTFALVSDGDILRLTACEGTVTIIVGEEYSSPMTATSTRREVTINIPAGENYLNYIARCKEVVALNLEFVEFQIIVDPIRYMVELVKSKMTPEAIEARVSEISANRVWSKLSSISSLEEAVKLYGDHGFIR